MITEKRKIKKRPLGTRSIRRLPPLDTMAMAKCGRFTETSETTKQVKQ